MSTFVLIHGAASDSRDWDLVTPRLEEKGHEVLAPDLPCEDDFAGLPEYADSVVRVTGDREELVVVGHSFGGFTAPLVCDRLPVDLLVMVNGMVPAPGESPGEWWGNTGWNGRSGETDVETMEVFFHDVPEDLARATIRRGKSQSGRPFEKPWPSKAWPRVPTRVLLGRDDRFLPAEFQRRVAHERLGIISDEMPGGHLVALSQPQELADRLGRYAAGE